MADVRQWAVRVSLVLAVALPLGLVALYVANPLGARSADPRERILGHGLYRIPGESMAPTLVAGDLVLVRSAHYRRHRPRRGELATFANPRDAQVFLKRIVGLPGETLSIRGGRLHIDGHALEEPYVLSGNAVAPYSRELPDVRIPEGTYFLLGDNRDNSDDSRFFGPVPLAALEGRVSRTLAAQAASYAP